MTAPPHRIRVFKRPFDNEQFMRAVRNTIVISIYSLLFGFPAPIIVGRTFNEELGKIFRRTAQTTAYLPHFVSSALIVGLVVTDDLPVLPAQSTLRSAGSGSGRSNL